MRRSRAAIALFAGLISVLAAFLPVGAGAYDAASGAATFEDTGEFTPAVLPGAADPNRRMTVVLQLAGDPVARVQATAPGKRLDDALKAQIHQDLQSKQDGIKQAIQDRGATILGQYQDAYNGIKVTAPVSALASLSTLPNVVAVRPVSIHTLDNTVSVPYIGTQAAWQGAEHVDGVTGRGIRVAVIDTGIDYTHANFGGPGTVAAYQAAQTAARAGLAPDPSLFGPDAPKVKGGIDLVGDAYNANVAGSQPVPGPNPLDCAGHGSHTAGTAAGLGVTSDGHTYRGPYDSTTYSHSFSIGPGVAPGADIYAIRVFGCAGSTNVVTDALDWAVKHDMQVINMSLGSSYGSPTDPDVVATNNAVAAGIVVVASAGNSGQNPYITGSPAIAERAISVAATDSTASFPGALIALGGGRSVQAIVANGGPLPIGSVPVVVLRNPNGTMSLGCESREYDPSTNGGISLAGKLVVTSRGTCARVLRAQLAQQAGAAGALMVNTSNAYPPFEGAIDGVTIPFFGVRSADKAALLAADGAWVSFTSNRLPNPTYRRIIDFSSGGPRRGDSALKPDVTAPGVSIVSTGMGTGNGGATMSGTSMAAPHVAGVAALVRQAHPEWSTGEVKAAIVNTADPNKVLGYTPSAAGNGLVQPAAAVATGVVATVGDPNQESDSQQGDSEGDHSANPTLAATLNFGFAEVNFNFHATQSFQLTRVGDGEGGRFEISVVQAQGSTPHVARVNRAQVGTGEAQRLTLTLDVPAATVGDSSAFRDVSGQVVLIPVNGGNNGVAIRVPYYMVPRGRSAISTTVSPALNSHGGTFTTTSTNRGAIGGSTDFYALGLRDGNPAFGELGLKAVGVQNSGGGYATFAVNTFGRFNSADVNEYDIPIWTRSPTTARPDFIVFAIDYGLIQTGSFSGTYVAGVLNMTSGRVQVRSLAFAPTDSSIIELPFKLSDIGVAASSPRFSYSAQSYNNRGETQNSDSLGLASFDAFSPAVTTGVWDSIPAGGSATESVTVNAAEWARSRTLGLMIVSPDNSSGAGQAQLIPAA